MTVDIDACITVLEQYGVSLDPGIDATRIREIEQRFGFVFSPDHRRLLERAQPADDGWLHWSKDGEESIRDRLAWPLDGVLFDVEHADFWPQGWGARPSTEAERRSIATERVGLWPTLVPLFVHRYMPAAPAGPGAPVFSVHQTDVVLYGDDLLDYLHRELSPGGQDAPRREPTVGAEWCAPWSSLAFGEDVVE